MNTKKRIRFYAVCIGWAGLIGTSALFYYIFLTAVFGGSDFQVLVDFNRFNEGVVETFGLLILLPLITYVFIFEMKTLTKWI